MKKEKKKSVEDSVRDLRNFQRFIFFLSFLNQSTKARFIIIITGWPGPLQRNSKRRYPTRLEHYLKTKIRKVTLAGFGVTGPILIGSCLRTFYKFLFQSLTLTCCLSHHFVSCLISTFLFEKCTEEVLLEPMPLCLRVFIATSLKELLLE